jgi:hypothetical protein
MEKTSTYFYTGRFLPPSWLRHDLGGLYLTKEMLNLELDSFISLFFLGELGDSFFFHKNTLYVFENHPGQKHWLIIKQPQ